jgi:hypothetical protein
MALSSEKAIIVSSDSARLIPSAEDGDTASSASVCVWGGGRGSSLPLAMKATQNLGAKCYQVLKGFLHIPMITL